MATAAEMLLIGEHNHRKGDVSSAEVFYTAALGSDPDLARAWQNMGKITAERGQLASAIAMTEKAIALSCQEEEVNLSALAYCNLGNMFTRVGKFKEAKESFLQAEMLGFSSWELFSNLGALHYQLGEPEEAIEWYSKTFETAPEDRIRTLCADLGYSYLMKGDYEKGWSLVSDSWSQPCKEIVALGEVDQWDPAHPVDFEDKVVLVYHNQGFGDTIQFLRFLPQLTPHCKKVIVAVPQVLMGLYSSNYTFKGVHILDIDYVGSVEFDICMPLSHLPQWSSCTLENLPGISGPYLETPQTKFINNGTGRALRVGIVWSARQDHVTGLRRSIPFHKFLPLASMPDIKLYGLQCGRRSRDIKAYSAELLVEDMSPKIANFRDLTGLMGEMDVIVSADTAPLHLAGALGKTPTIALLSNAGSDWRWLSRNTYVSPWYPKVNILRQSSCDEDNWDEVIRSVGQYLKMYVSSSWFKRIADYA